MHDPDSPLKFIRFGVYKVKSFVVFYSEGLQYKCPLLPIWDWGSAIMDTVGFIDGTNALLANPNSVKSQFSINCSNSRNYKNLKVCTLKNRNFHHSTICLSLCDVLLGQLALARIHTHIGSVLS